MKLIKLPSVLSNDIDLAEINKQLKERTAQLDWSSVESAPTKHLATLLIGLDLSDDADVLGIEGEIADNIASDIVKFFNEQSTSNKSTETKKSSSSSKEANPQVWAPSENQVIESTESFQDTDPSEDSLNDISKIEETLSQIPSQPLLSVLSPYQIRAELEKAILDDLLGPAGGEQEEINEAKVSDRYLVGLLAPLHRKQFVEREVDEDLALGGQDSVEDGATDTSIPAAHTMMPSSFGMTFSVDGQAKAIKISASWGQYDKVKSESITTEHGNPKSIWRRRPIKGKSTAIKLKEGQIDKWVIDSSFQNVYVQGLIRKHNDEWIISLFLVNGQTEPKENSDAAWLFQPEIAVTSADSSFPDIFVRRPQLKTIGNIDSANYLEEQSMNMLYRKQVEFAVGHGVSVHAEVSPTSNERATSIKTAVVPAYEVPKVTPPTVDEIPDLAGLVLDMKELAETPIRELVNKLNPLTTAYKRWIDEQKNILTKDQSLADFQTIAQLAIDNCSHTLARIQEGIRLLAENNKAAEAFQFMNRAMWQQRIHSIFSEKKRRGEEATLETVDVIKNRTWFPFQLAFILLNLPSITDLHHEDRCHETAAIADLLWFPTGGGKTEAYLGLTAYTLGLRRLQGTIAGRSGEHGIAVLMRYTLRLLTLQQFQRATALICACESIRREATKAGSLKWGREPFRIGLWVGKRTTPNTTQQSEEFTKQARGTYQGVSGSPHQLTNCPWCGTKIDEGKNIKVEPFGRGHGRTLVYCGDSLGRCLFSERNSPTEGLPVVVVDEEIYRRLPSLLISTVDKFAQMPWNGATQMLFGQVDAYCERHGFKSPEIEDSSHPKRLTLPATKLASHNPVRPPDLIIQDELHLISGPLGTLVGLYETAVDKLASWEVDGKLVRPKVVASTATIRQAKEQIYNLFLRKVQVFPPQGLDVSDNFFARQRVPSEKDYGRRYLGICAPGRRLTAALIRVYVATLSASQSLYLKYGMAADPWMTLVGYFNSLRELAGMRRQVDDNIRSRLGKMDRRGLAKRNKLYFEELTSRKNSTDIPQILDWLEIPFDPVRQKRIDEKRKNREKVTEKEPLDVLLATNMLSVGVDVKRLGVMVVANQPKNTAEYIQATSRVGRTYPGLVFTVYNWARPRDLSHYESFEQYHATFYKHVEALSITPFAPGAIERGLSALLVSLVRLSGREFNENSQAERVTQMHPYAIEAIKTIANRAWAVGSAKTRDYVEAQLKAKMDFWLSQAQNTAGGFKLGYESSRDGVTIGLLKNPFALQWEPFTCLRSLRNVEPTVALILDDRLPEDELNRNWQSMDEDSEIQDGENR